jgi:putative ABC transport system ATP-binding protein
MSEISTNNALIHCDKLVKIYKLGEVEVMALRGLDLTVKNGEFLAVLGPSGCGKTTLLQIIGGLATATSGSVVVDGMDMGHGHDGARTHFRQTKIGFVFQRFNLLPFLSASDNVRLAMQIRGEKIAAYEEKVQEIMRLVGLEKRMHNRPNQLSQGEQQRVAIARALITEPAILLADEPTGNLDSANSERILNLMRKLNQELGQTILMITHDTAAASYATRRVRMLDGIIVDQNA